jgi:hypothetical protein
LLIWFWVVGKCGLFAFVLWGIAGLAVLETGATEYCCATTTPNDDVSMVVGGSFDGNVW